MNRWKDMDVPPNVMFIAILLVVPAQYFLSPSSSAHIKFHLHSFLSSVKKYLPETSISNKGVDTEGTVPEDEIDDTKEYGLGKYQRIRAPHVEFRVGDVIRHKVFDYRAVVIGWDLTAQAPDDFIKTTHKGNKEWTNNPNYAVAIDVRDRMMPQIGYIVQENMELSSGQIMSPLVDKYFDEFDEMSQRYIIRPAFRRAYPDD